VLRRDVSELSSSPEPRERFDRARFAPVFSCSQRKLSESELRLGITRLCRCEDGSSNCSAGILTSGSQPLCFMHVGLGLERCNSWQPARTIRCRLSPHVDRLEQHAFRLYTGEWVAIQLHSKASTRTIPADDRAGAIVELRPTHQTHHQHTVVGPPNTGLPHAVAGE